MSPQGTAAYDGLADLPPLVERAVYLARRLGFANSCRPEHGRLLHALAAGGGYPPDPEELLEPGGTVVIDDLTPASTWPPRFGGQVDQARMHWLTHPALDAAELRLAPDLAALVATRRFPA